MHLIIDGHGGDPELLGDANAVQALLLRIPIEIGMTPIDGPRVLRYNGGKKPEAWGVTGNVIIAESHIAIHTFPEYRFAAIDVSSCKDFDVILATRLIIEAFRFGSRSRVQLVERDLDTLLESSPAEQ